MAATGLGMRGRAALGARWRSTLVPVYLAMVILSLAVLAAVLAPLLVPYSPFRLDPLAAYLAPSPAHPLGSDSFGRDIFSRIVFGARVSLGAGLAVSLLSSALGTVLGLTAGLTRADEGLMRILDGLMAFPGILLAVALVAALGAGTGNVVIALTVVLTPRTARLVRSVTLAAREELFVEAARAVGCPFLRLMVRHILPTCIAAIVVQATYSFALAVQVEAALSFLGVGTPREIPSWGNMVAEGQVALRVAPWVSIFPGSAIVVAVLALNIIGDYLRDRTDPRLRGA